MRVMFGAAGCATGTKGAKGCSGAKGWSATCTIPPCTLSCTGGSVPYAQGVFYANGNTYWPWVGGISFCLSNMPINTGITQNGVYGKITALSMPQALTPDLSGNVATDWSNTYVGTFQYYSDGTYTTPTTSVQIAAYITLGCASVTGPCQRPTLTGAVLTIRTLDGNVTFFSGQVDLTAFTATIDTTPDPTDPAQWIWYADACMNNGTGPDAIAAATAGASGCMRLCLDWVCENCGDPAQGGTPFMSPESKVTIQFANVAYTYPPDNSSCSFSDGNPSYIAPNYVKEAAALGNSTISLVQQCPMTTEGWDSVQEDQWEIVARSACSIDGSGGVNQTELCLVDVDTAGTQGCAMLSVHCAGPSFNDGHSGNLEVVIQGGGTNSSLILTMDGRAANMQDVWYNNVCTNPARFSGTVTTTLTDNTCKSSSSPNGAIGVPVDFPAPL